MASVSLHDVTRSFGDVHVVRGVNLEIRDGEFVVLVGGSGCGKSTLLRLLVGLDAPTSGEIRIDGRVVNDVRPRDRDVAMVFQSYALYPHMTVRDNMAFALKVSGESPARIQAAVEESARMLELGDLLERYPKELSGGQRQRVAMGRALVRRPRLFLFDEPLSNLDASLRAQMRVELKRLHELLGITTVYVTHDQVEAMTLADRIALMQGGVIQQYGPPRRLYDWPANRYVAGFLGSPPMNFATLRREGNVLLGEGIRLPLDAASLLAPLSEGATLEAGVRPHDLRLTQDANAAVQGTLYALEPMGWETIAHVQVGAVRFTARIETSDAAGLRTGDPVGFHVDASRVRLFDLRGGLALQRPAEET